MNIGPMEIGLVAAMLLFYAIPILAGIALTAFWIVSLVDVLKVPSDSDYRTGTKLIWVLIILFAHFIGAIIYYCVGKPVARRVGQFE